MIALLSSKWEIFPAISRSNKFEEQSTSSTWIQRKAQVRTDHQHWPYCRPTWATNLKDWERNMWFLTSDPDSAKINFWHQVIVIVIPVVLSHDSSGHPKESVRPANVTTPFSETCNLATDLIFLHASSMTSSPYTSAEYNYHNAFRNLVCNVSRSSCFSIRFGNSRFAWK